MGVTVWRVTIKPNNESFGRHVGVGPETMVAFQRRSEHVVIPPVAQLSRIGAPLMLRHLGHAMVSPQALLGPVGPQWTPGGTVVPVQQKPLRFVRPAAPIGAAVAMYKTVDGLQW